MYLEGRLLGDTPLIDIELPSGEHVLRLRNDEEHIDKSIRIEIKPGQRTVKKLKLS